MTGQKAMKRRKMLRRHGDPAARNLIVIGASAGGHAAIPKVIKNLPSDFPGAIVVMLHLPRSPVFHFPRWLGQFGNLPVSVVMDGMRPEDGHVYVAPPGQFVSVEKGVLRVDAESPKRRHYCIDELFRTAAISYQDRTIGVILTGGGSDGTKGLAAIDKAGGQTIVQNPQDAEQHGMPTSALKAVPVQYCLDVADIGDALDLLARTNAELESGLTASVRYLKQRAQLVRRIYQESKRNERTKRFLEKELHRLAKEILDLQDLVNIEHGTSKPAACDASRPRMATKRPRTAAVSPLN